MKKRWIILLGSVATLAILASLQYFGIIWHNELFAMRYQIKGLDVSHHQNDIDWKTVQEQNDFSFIYMKATEGRDFTDHKFAYNWEEARKHGFPTGAYHFFSMQSTGKDQAAHFIRTVPKEPDALPPVIDIEIHLDHSPQKVRQELQEMSDLLEKHYDKKPILYVTYDTYYTYIEGAFPDHKIWIRDIVKHPDLNGREWVIWQYSNRGRVQGIDTYVDINVLRGDLEDLQK